MRELADELGCDASNITQIVTRLEGRGLVERHADPGDRRSRQLTRTPTGDTLTVAFEETFEFARTATSNLSLDEQAAHKRLQTESQKRRINITELAKKVIESEKILGGF